MGRRASFGCGSSRSNLAPSSARSTTIKGRPVHRVRPRRGRSPIIGTGSTRDYDGRIELARGPPHHASWLESRRTGPRGRDLGRYRQAGDHDRRQARRALLEPVHDWPDLLAAGVRADGSATTRSGPGTTSIRSSGSPDGPIFEGWLTLRRLGAGDRADPHRPDGRRQHVPRTGADGQDGHDARPHLERSGDPRHRRRPGSRPSTRRSASHSATGFPERLRWLGEALPIMRGMLHGERPTATGPRYAAKAVRNDPPPIQARLPMLIGGGGEQVTLKLVARYARCEQRRRRARQREAQGGDPPPALRDGRVGTRPRSSGPTGHRDRDHPRLARRGGAAGRKAIFERNGRARRWTDQPVGTPEDVAEALAPFLEIGYRHLIAGFPAPYDEESMTRLATEVRPLLERG